MNRQLVVRVLETFFRRWWLYLLPVLVLLGLGAVSFARTTERYTATGIMYTNDTTLLSQLAGGRVANTPGWQTPAGLVTQQVQSVLQTEDFMRTIIERAELTPLVQSGADTVGGLRSAIAVFPNGYNLVVVRASHAIPDVSYRLAQSTFDSFIDWIVESELGESSAAQEFFEGLIVTYETELAEAQQALTAYLAEHPAPPLGDRPVAEQLEVDRLTAAVTTAEGRYDDAVAKNQNAQLAAAQTREDVAQRFRLVDEPSVPFAPDSGLRSRLMSFMLYGALALLVLAAAVMVGTVLDRSIRTPDDVTKRYDLTALALVPAVPTRRTRRSRRAPPARAPAKAPTRTAEATEAIPTPEQGDTDHTEEGDPNEQLDEAHATR